MTIQSAILGLLSWRPLTGYDLKKILSSSDVFYWSGNNNQIYNTLIQLRQEELVTQEVQPQENLPARKIYTITEKGREALRQWLLSAPELPELRNTFLIQLSWADLLTGTELDNLLAGYEEELALQVRMQQEKARRPRLAPDRTPRETFLWAKITENILNRYQCELDWVRGVRAGLKEI